MGEIFGIPLGALLGQLLVGLINGSLYALMSLGVAIIFGMLRIANFVHGAQYMLGAFVGWGLLNIGKWFPQLGIDSIGYWPSLILVPLIVGAVGVVMEKLFISKVYDINHAYGVLLTLGLALVIEGLFHVGFGSSGRPYEIPASLRGGANIGFMFLPYYRVWVLVASLAVCVLTWWIVERTRLGSYLRAATENPTVVESFGINVPRMLTLTYGGGVALAALAGLMAAPIQQVSPQMGQNMIIIVFAIVVIGGMGSIMGSIVSGFALGVIEGLTKVFWSEASSTIIFVLMALVLLWRPHGLFGGRVAIDGGSHGIATGTTWQPFKGRWPELTPIVLLGIVGLLAPLVLYPAMAMKIWIFALFACAFNLIFGFGGMLAFGHAAFFGAATYAAAHTAKYWGLTPELAVLVGAAVAALLGLVIGWIAIRRQGIYFAMITLALAQLVYFYAVQAPWTRGEDGVQGIPRGDLFGVLSLADDRALYYFVFAVFLIGFALVHRIVRSPFGQVLKSIRDNEPRAISLGYSVDNYKLMAFVLSAALSGLAGALSSVSFGVAMLTNVHFSTSAEVLLMVLIGGVGTIFGPVVGAAVLVGMQYLFAGTGSWVLILQGVVFILCVLGMRNGIVGTLGGWLAARQAAPADPQPNAEPAVAGLQPKPTLKLRH
ncbi:MAG TPA: branched-chain amino acid ABC transporter permease [Ramlibacter sp.]|nr:branched-chain amino acid ABC transporter permease [Ramlibacter sp.]